MCKTFKKMEWEREWKEIIRKKYTCEQTAFHRHLIIVTSKPICNQRHYHLPFCIYDLTLTIYVSIKHIRIHFISFRLFVLCTLRLTFNKQAYQINLQHSQHFISFRSKWPVFCWSARRLAGSVLIQWLYVSTFKMLKDYLRRWMLGVAWLLWEMQSQQKKYKKRQQQQQQCRLHKNDEILNVTAKSKNKIHTKPFYLIRIFLLLLLLLLLFFFYSKELSLTFNFLSV